MSIIFNAYPESIGGRLTGAVALLKRLNGLFDGFYIMPTLYESDIDRGFSVIDYRLNTALASLDDIHALQRMGVKLILDMVLNHLSTQSPQFQDVLQHGRSSRYYDFFIDWNAFWQGHGVMTEEGYIQPDPALIAGMNFRKPGLPILMTPMPDGTDVPFWNTFYQKVTYPHLTASQAAELTGLSTNEAYALATRINAALDDGQSPREITNIPKSVADYLHRHRHCLGQMDLNVQSDDVWRYYAHIMDTLASWGTGMIRLDAFVRLHKAVGRPNFVNEPETWQILTRLRDMAAQRGMAVLPEMHIPHGDDTASRIGGMGCPVYDFYLPGLILDAVITGDPTYLAGWIDEAAHSPTRRVNMLGCHDGIPMRDLKGLLPQERIDSLAQALFDRGGQAKLIHGQRTEVYQMGISYYSALNEDDNAMALARAIQLFTPGDHQVWYMDLLCRPSDLTVLAAGADPREVNRAAITQADAEGALTKPGVIAQLELLRLCREHPAFGSDARVTVQTSGQTMTITRQAGDHSAALHADFATLTWRTERTQL